MNKVTVYDILTGEPRVWLVPTKAQSIKNATDTWGVQYDPIEGELVRGCIPVAMQRFKPV